jgi:hypothetical protein
MTFHAAGPASERSRSRAKAEASMIQRCCVLSLIAASCLFASVASGQDAGDAKAKDEKLVSAIKAAIEKGLAPDKVEDSVGSKATLNTFRKEDRGPFSRADIVPDPDRKPALPDRDSLQWVAYWIRPVEGRNPKLVGIFWPKKEGKPQIFFGEILPPR